MNASLVRAGSIVSRWAVLGVAAGLLAACGGVSELTKERVERSQTVVNQAEQTVGRSEYGALELQRARDHLARAQRAVENDDDEEAQRQAQQATLTAELAVARSQSGSARRAADELLASIEALRREAGLDGRAESPPQR